MIATENEMTPEQQAQGWSELILWALNDRRCQAAILDMALSNADEKKKTELEK